MPLTIGLDILSVKKVILRIFFYHYAKIKIDSHDSLLPLKTLTLYDIVVLIGSVFKKDQNHYYCNIFSEKCLYQLAKK